MCQSCCMIALQRFGVPAVVVSDRWRAAELTQSLDAAGFPGAELCCQGDGLAGWGGRLSCLCQCCRRPTNPNASISFVDVGAISGAVVMKDPAGNIKLQKTKHRDDAAAAAILAVAEGTRRHGLMHSRPKAAYRASSVAFSGIIDVCHSNPRSKYQRQYCRGPLWERTRLSVLAIAMDWRCLSCGKYGNEAHHIIPL